MKTEKVTEHIVSWLKDYADKAGLKGFVIGVSGGIDSAVTSTLCAKTGLELLVLEMPIHQAESQISRASRHIAWLQKNFANVRREWVDLTQVFDSMISVLPPVDKEERPFYVARQYPCPPTNEYLVLFCRPRRIPRCRNRK